MKYMLAGVLMVSILAVGTYGKPVMAFGFGSTVYKPFGGLVTSKTLGTVVCTGGTGPVTQKPAGSSPATSYNFPYGKTTPPKVGSWVLGMYGSVSDVSTCYTQAGPYRVPYTTNRVVLWGVSR